MATECGPFHFGLVRARERTSKNGGYSGYSGYTTTKHSCGPDVSRDRGVATGYIFSGYTMATRWLQWLHDSACVDGLEGESYAVVLVINFCT